jgi:DNA polymerase III epsilon subunit-like protein
VLAIAAVPTWEQAPFHCKVQPWLEQKIDPEAARVNGYTEEGWRIALSLDHAMGAFRNWLAWRPKEIEEVSPLAHNAGFDRAFLDWAEICTGISLGLTHRWRCSMAVLAFLQDMGLCTPRYGEGQPSCSLDALCALSGQERPAGAHDALVDAECALRGYVWMVRQISGAMNEPLKMSRS